MDIGIASKERLMISQYNTLSCHVIAYSIIQIYHLIYSFQCINSMQDLRYWCFLWLWNHRNKWRSGVYVGVV